MDFLLNLPVVLWTLWAFVLGAAVGSLLNVVVARLPLEKSLIWPGSRCGRCFQPIRWYDNIPLVSYWILRGRCRSCGAPFSIRYFIIELVTALAFAALFVFELLLNGEHVEAFSRQRWHFLAGQIPWTGWAFFVHRATLMSLLLAAAFCDLDRREIPLGLTFFGAAIGLGFAIAFPWPWPHGIADANVVPGTTPWWMADPATLGRGLYPWPVWGPLPDWMPLGSRRAGLATGFAGMLVGSWMLRGVRFLFSRGLGREALGLGDADLMMMVGAFLGWQPVVVAFFAGGLFSLAFAVIQAVVNRENALPFGPGLAAGAMATVLAWRWIGPAVQPLFFHADLMMVFVGGGAAFMLAAALMFRVLRRRGESSAG